MLLRMLLACIALTMALTMARPVQAQQAPRSQFAIRADDGDRMPNHALTQAQAAALARLPGLVDTGGPKASGTKSNVTLYQFYDLNCPYCRRASADLDSLVNGDEGVRLVLVPYPVLSAQSVEGARVELAVRELISGRQFLEFHRKLYAGRGVIDGARALAAANEMGVDSAKIVEIGNQPRITETMKTHAKLGTDLKLLATPSYVIQGVAIVGHPGLDPLRKIVAAVRACKKVVC